MPPRQVSLEFLGLMFMSLRSLQLPSLGRRISFCCSQHRRNLRCHCRHSSLTLACIISSQNMTALLSHMGYLLLPNDPQSPPGTPRHICWVFVLALRILWTSWSVAHKVSPSWLPHQTARPVGWRVLGRYHGHWLCFSLHFQICEDILVFPLLLRQLFEAIN